MKIWTKITTLITGLLLFFPALVLAAGPKGGPTGHRGRYPEIYRLGGLVDQSL